MIVINETDFLIRHCASGDPCWSKLSYARHMRSSRFCLVLAGDTATSSRLYDAMACDCLPIIISDNIRPHLAFPGVVKYDNFVGWINENEFQRDPMAASRIALQQGINDEADRRKAMKQAKQEALYHTTNSRIGHNLLVETYTKCVEAIDLDQL